MTRRRGACLLLAALAGGSAVASTSGGDRDATLTIIRRYGGFTPAEEKELLRQIEAGPRDLALQRDAAQKEGILLRLPDLQVALPPAQRNAAPLYTRLMTLLEKKPLDPVTDRVRGSLGARVAHSEADVAAVERLLAERQDVMALAHEAAAKPECVFRRDWTQGMLLRTPEYPAIRETARLLTADSYFLARAGRFEEAIANQAQLFRVAGHGPTDPCLIGYLVGVACDAIALHGMDNILCLAGPNAGVAERVRSAIAANRPRLNLRRSLQGELALYMSTVAMMKQDPSEAVRLGSLFDQSENESSMPQAPPTAPEAYTPLQRRVWGRYMDASAACYLRHLRALIASLDQPYLDRKPLLAQMGALDQAAKRNPLYALAPVFVLAPASVRQDQDRAKAEVLMAAAAVLAYRARRNAYPDRLDQVISPPPMDPFSTGALRYRREGEGFAVYSVGSEGKLDGSKPGMRIASQEAYFRYPPIPLPPQRN